MSNGVRSLRVLLTLAVALAAIGCPQLRNDAFQIAAGPAADAGVPPPHTAQCDPYTVCEDTCVDTQSNPAHCGACGIAIGDGQICSRGRAVSEDVGCEIGTLCNRGCVDTNSHPFFCGACDVTCGTRQRCTMGRCQCVAPLKDCGGVCLECCTNSDCRGDRTCSDNVCELECASPLEPCDDDCVDLNADPKNCGRCRNDCGPGGVCTNGACR